VIVFSFDRKNTLENEIFGRRIFFFFSKYYHTNYLQSIFFLFFVFVNRNLYFIFQIYNLKEIFYQLPFIHTKNCVAID
jgi:hypothetical protein